MTLGILRQQCKNNCPKCAVRPSELEILTASRAVMSAPPISIFAHDKKAETHADSRAWLKSRVSSPPHKAPALIMHSPVTRKGGWRLNPVCPHEGIKLYQASLIACRWNADYAQAQRVPELSSGCSVSSTAFRIQGPSGLFSQT